MNFFALLKIIANIEIGFWGLMSFLITPL
jgi:hypothetical protein